MFRKSIIKKDVSSDDQSGPFIEIELHNEYAFTSGTALEGCIHLNIGDENLNNVDKVSIQILGEEITSIKWKKNSTPIEQRNTILDKRFTCYDESIKFYVLDYKTFDNTS